MMMAKQTLAQAIHLARSGKSKALAHAATRLHGLAPGGWGETQQAMRDIGDQLPMRDARDYTIDDFVAAAYTLEGGDARSDGVYRSILRS